MSLPIGPEISVDAEVGERVHQIMWRQRIKQGALGAALGIGQSGVSKKLRGQVPWTIADLIAAADALGVEVTALLPEKHNPHLTTSDGGSVLPRLDSNQQPSD